MPRLSALLLPCLIPLGCATGFDRGALRQRLERGQPQVTDQEIGRVLAIRPQLVLPFRLGVYFEPLEGGGTFAEAEKQVLLGLEKDLRASGIVSDVFPVAHAAFIGRTDPHDLGDVRLAAARHDADAVLVVRGVAETDSYANPLSLLYLTIVGMAVVPGTTCDALYLLESSLWDVRNECLYLTAAAEGTASGIRPEAFLRREPIIAEARTAAFAALGIEVCRRFERLSPRPVWLGTARVDSRP